MQRQLAQLVRLVDDLLDLNRIDHGRILLRRERVAVADVLEQAIETTRSLIDSRGHRLTLDLPAATLALDADPVRLGQVFANLLSNAAKYTEPGGSIAVQDSSSIAASRQAPIGLCPLRNGYRQGFSRHGLTAFAKAGP